MAYSRITVEQRDHLFLMGLNRPKRRNAFDVEMYMELAEAFGELHRNDELRCGVLFAHGEHFTTGLELDKWASVFQSGGVDIPQGAIHPLGIDEDNRCRKPVVMAVRGRCYTVGLELLLAQDVRVVASDVKIAALEVKRGIYPVGGATVRLFQEIGWGNAMRYLLTGDEITAEEALRMGMVQQVTAPGAELEAAIELAGKIAKAAPLGVTTALNSARIARKEGERAALRRLIPDLLPLIESEDVKEGILSFIEKREAIFKGK